MAVVVVLGAGICGLATALLLHRDGHAVTVLERDPAPVPDSPEDAWERWRRPGVGQFRQAHYLLPRGSGILGAELPDVRDALLAAGAVSFDSLTQTPPTVTVPDRRPGDEAFVTVTGRRQGMRAPTQTRSPRSP